LMGPTLMSGRRSRFPRMPGFRFSLHQRLQIRFQACPVHGRVPEQRVDQMPLPKPEMAADASLRKPVQQAHRFLREQSFEFVSGHVFLVNRET
ncbi:MAG: hypothetical protein ACREJ4_11480, partial [Candidatus Methylomirabilaceae bacterium]